MRAAWSATQCTAQHADFQSVSLALALRRKNMRRPLAAQEEANMRLIVCSALALLAGASVADAQFPTCFPAPVMST
jgi:hypothetical protein